MNKYFSWLKEKFKLLIIFQFVSFIYYLKYKFIENMETEKSEKEKTPLEILVEKYKKEINFIEP